MRYEVDTPKEYLNKLKLDWRKEKLNQVREMIKKHGPNLVKGLNIKCFLLVPLKKVIFNLNAQKELFESLCWNYP